MHLNLKTTERAHWHFGYWSGKWHAAKFCLQFDHPPAIRQHLEEIVAEPPSTEPPANSPPGTSPPSARDVAYRWYGFAVALRDVRRFVLDEPLPNHVMINGEWVLGDPDAVKEQAEGKKAQHTCPAAIYAALVGKKYGA